MTRSGSQRYLNDMLIRLMDLRRCISAVEADQLIFSAGQRHLAVNSLIEEYQRIEILVQDELSTNHTANTPSTKPMPPQDWSL